MNENFRKKKQYGQNFLTNKAIPQRIVKESGITENDGVIEIGPGFGILTKELCAAAKKVVSIEIDSELISILNENMSGTDNFKLINCDILKTDISSLIKNEFQDMDVCVCANLPYYITSETVMKLLEGEYGFKTITVMVQKEVAERFCSKPGTPQYGAITAAINYYADVKRLFTVKAGSFSPKPKVDSAVIRFDVFREPPVSTDSRELFFEIIKAAFGKRRKTLVNAVYSVFSEKIPKEDILKVIKECGFDENIRGEQLDISAYAKISDSLNKIINQ